MIRFTAIVLCFCAFYWGLPAIAATSTRGKELLLNGAPYFVRGVHYGPWRAGTGPGKGYSYPSREAVASDLRLIKGLSANTIVVYDPPDYVLDLAKDNALNVLYLFFIQWWTIGSPEGAGDRQRVIERVERLKHHPALAGWVLGNEVPVAVLEVRHRDAIEQGLADLYKDIKTADPFHVVTHANWPATSDLRLQFFDLIGFNVYPLWPPEVAALGFGRYLRERIQPIAGEKPLLVTEFGVSSLEAGNDGQADILSRSWQGLRDARACGGVVFEFADQWWKNYDNPRRPQNFWDRVPAPDDEKTQDTDPEENYGLFTSDRKEKPAAAAVRLMFTDNGRRWWSSIRTPHVLVAAFIALAVLASILPAARLRRSRRNAPDRILSRR